MPEIDFAFLADAAETIPGQKFHVLGGGVARIGGRRFPLRHPHLALVIGLQVTAPETEREHEIRFVLLDPDGAEVAGATGSVVARSQRDGRDAILTFSIDLWNLTFPAPGDYSFRILVNGSERKRLPLVLLKPSDADGESGTAGARSPDELSRGSPGPCRRPPATSAPRSTPRVSRRHGTATGCWPRRATWGSPAGRPTSSRSPSTCATTSWHRSGGRRCGHGRHTARRTRSATRCRSR